MGHMMNVERVVNDHVRSGLGTLEVAVVELEMQALVAGEIIMNQRGIFLPASPAGKKHPADHGIRP